MIVPAHTFIATWLAVSPGGRHAGAGRRRTWRTYNLDPAAAEAAIDDATRALVPVHLYGQPADMDALRALADRHGLLLLEDAAQAHGARLHGRRAGALGDAAAFSFYPAKNLGALGDGGAVTTDDAELAERLRVLRNYGSSARYVHASRAQQPPGRAAGRACCASSWRTSTSGTPAAAALGGALPGGLHRGCTPRDAPGAEHVWHLFVVRHPERDRLQRELRESGIETLIHYPVAPHLCGAYEGIEAPREQVECAETIAREVLSLPMGPHVSDEQALAVIEAVSSSS